MVYHFKLGLILTYAAFTYLKFAAAKFECPNFFTNTNDRCYLFSSDTKLLTWQEAHNYCQSFTEGIYSYDLFVITDNHEYVLISQELVSRGHQSSFIGALDLGQTNTEWFWVNGTKLPSDSLLWDCEYPKDVTTNGTVGQFSLVTESVPGCSTVNTYRLRNVNSTTLDRYICEGPPLPDCPTPFINLNDRCYMFSWDIDLQKTWEEARQYCKLYTEGTNTYDLLLIGDQSEYILISEALLKRGHEVLIGAIDLGQTSYDWFWINGTGLSLQSTLWDCDYPSSSTFDNVALFKFIDEQIIGCSTFNTFRIQNVPPETTNYFICEGPKKQ